jgi:hypothetical protein
MTKSDHKDTDTDADTDTGADTGTDTDTDTDTGADTGTGTPKSRRVASSTGLRWHLAPWAMRSIDFTGWH